MFLNYKCIPFVDPKGTNELQWRYDPDDAYVKEVLNMLTKSGATIDDLNNAPQNIVAPYAGRADTNEDATNTQLEKINHEQ